MGARNKVYMICMGKPEGKRPLRKPRRRWKDTIKETSSRMGLDCLITEVPFAAVEEYVLISTTSRLNFEPNQSPMQRVRGVLSPWIKREGCESVHSSPSVVEVKNGETVAALAHTSS
jgi:hypothetical protein